MSTLMAKNGRIIGGVPTVSDFKDWELVPSLKNNGDSWVAPSDGFLNLVIADNSATTEYTYVLEREFNDNAPIMSIMLVNGANGGTYTNETAVKKGHTYRISTNINNNTFRFRPVDIFGSSGDTPDTSEINVYPQFPSGVESYLDGIRLFKNGNICQLFVSVKITATAVGQNFSIPITLPNNCRVVGGGKLGSVMSNGAATGSIVVNLFHTSNSIDIYADKTGTTYAIGCMTYISEG